MGGGDEFYSLEGQEPFKKKPKEEELGEEFQVPGINGLSDLRDGRR